MICPKCRFEQADGNLECRRCGVIFEKYYAYVRTLTGSGAEESQYTYEDAMLEETPDPGRFCCLKEILFRVEPAVSPIAFGGRCLVFVGLFLWSWRFLVTPMDSNYVGTSFMHLINLPFHEAGHVIFSPFGRFVQILGGTLGQLLMPTICMFTLLLKTRDPFGASVGLWWTAESFMDAAPYINDARALQLTLLGGVTGREAPGFHDWENILGSLGWLQYDHLIANIFYGTGMALMATALLWGGYSLLLQFKNIEKIELE